jgi:serine/threonine protein kinase/Tol biopolymer transport system component
VTDERWPRVKALFQAAVERPPSERDAFLAAATGDDDALRREVSSLLASDTSNVSFLDQLPSAREPGHADCLAALPASMDQMRPHPVLTQGRRVGPYEIVASLGAGAMGEVYRARDTTLNRDVALKVLPELFAVDANRLARFTREAQVLASLNHPNIAAIYGLEEPNGTQALVLELVDGPTLADRIARGPLALDEALTIARQIGDALEAAHEKGIIHRDLKPANIKITGNGVVKVLDFGLAKVWDGSPQSDLAAGSPRVTATDIGGRTILGTPAYMSPEQARGKPLDKRTDIWSFGCVLYEMLTGRQAFAGETVSDTIAAILEREPEWEALPDTTPVTVRRLLQRCFEKDPRHRVRDIGDARIELDDALEGRATGAPVVRRARRERVAWIALALVTVAAALAVGSLLYLRRVPADTRVYRSSILLPAGVTNPGFTLSPDGRRLAFVGTDAGGATGLWVQSLDGLVAQPLADTEGAGSPFWSSDSRSIGFFVGGKVKRVEATGGSPVTLADAIPNPGATWNRGGTVLFASFGPGNPIRRVSASGGGSSPVTTLNSDNGETRHWFPFFLPDGRHFLYFAVGNKTVGPNSPNGIYVAALDSNERKLLVPGGSTAKYALGYLLFLREQTLMAQPFDVERLELTGDALPIAERVITGGLTGMAGAFSVSETGVLAYQTGPADVGGQAGAPTRLVWFDRSGKQIGVLGDQARHGDLELTADGGRVAVSLFDRTRRGRDIWLFDIARGLRTHFTFDPAEELTSVWSPDGSRVVFNANRKGHWDLYQKASSGAGNEEELLADSLDKVPFDWSPDGRFILFGVGAFQAAADLWVLPLFGDRKPFPFLQTPFSEIPGRFSPDGRWIAYASNESGRYELYVGPFPGRGDKWQVSTAGGRWPRWGSDGKEIFYLAPDKKLMSAMVNGAGSAFEVGAVRPLFDTHALTIGNTGSMYDVSPDGQRFLVNTLPEEAAPAPITLVVNWPALLRN